LKKKYLEICFVLKKSNQNKPQLQWLGKDYGKFFNKFIKENFNTSTDDFQGLYYCTITRDDCPVGKFNDHLWLCKIHRNLVIRWNENKFRSVHDFIAEHERLTWKVTKITIKLNLIKNYTLISPLQFIVTDGVQTQTFFISPPSSSSSTSSSSSLSSTSSGYDKFIFTLDFPWSFNLTLPRLQIEARIKNIRSSYNTISWTLLGRTELNLGRLCLPFIPYDLKRDCKLNKEQSITPFYITDKTSRMVEVELKRQNKKPNLALSPRRLTAPSSSPRAKLPQEQPLPSLQFDLTWWTSRPYWDSEENFPL